MIGTAARDLINIGAYVSGTDPEIDTAIRVNAELNDFLQQGRDEPSSFEETISKMEMVDQIALLAG